MRLDQLQVSPCLFRLQHVLEDRVYHRKRTVFDTSRVIAGMQQVPNATAVFEVRIAGEDVIHDQQALKIPPHGLRPSLKLYGFGSSPDHAERVRHCTKRLKVQCHRPRAAQAITHSGIDRLK